MGCERRVVYDFVNVIQGDATLNQALIKDKRTENLYILPASQTRDKDALTREGVDKVLEELKKMDFDFIVCDSPAGIETGALMALYLLMKPSSPPTRKSPPFATPTVSLAFSLRNPVVRKMAKSRSKSTYC